METNNSQNKTKYTRRLVEIAMLTAVAVILMMFEFPVPFVPPFYKIDLSDLPALVGSFAIGPVAGVIIEALKVLLHVVTKGTESMWVGELANFIVGCSLILPASIIYKFRKTKKNAFIGLIIGTVFMTTLGAIINAYVLLPMYAKVYGMPLKEIIKMGTAVNSNINSVLTFVMLAVTPFNLVKGILIGLITMLIYKKIRLIIK